MTIHRGIRGVILAVLLATLMAAPVAASPAWASGPTVRQVVTFWLGELLGVRLTTPIGGAAQLKSLSGQDVEVGGPGEVPSPTNQAGIFKLKQHVDNPAQAAMKDG
jgi:hypothetical protein